LVYTAKYTSWNTRYMAFIKWKLATLLSNVYSTEYLSSSTTY